jgi:N-acetyl-anhydromuramyl-L-alanine amidase AmpD
MTYSDDLRSVLNTIVVHHSAYPHAGPTEIQNLHMDRRGFADVAYHFLIDTEGIIYEGRELNIRGAHVQGFNTGSVGIVLLGNFNDEQPSEAQISSLRSLVHYLHYAYEIRYLAGHKDYPDQSPDGTECPGDHLYPLLPALVRSLGMKYGIDGYVGPVE